MNADIRRMDAAAVDILCENQYQELLEQSLEENPERFALRLGSRGLPAAVLATQLKYLQRSRQKLPAFYEARCILPPTSWEQATHATVCRLRPAFHGDRLLDLTCGLGADFHSLAPGFREALALEQDALLVRIARENFRRLGLTHATVQHTTAEAFLHAYDGPPWDLLFVDPARRDGAGNRSFRFQDCSPDVLALQDLLLRHSRRVWIKASPLFDLHEATRLFRHLRTLHVFTLRNEVKEVALELEAGYTGPVQHAAHGHGGSPAQDWHFTALPQAPIPLPPGFDPRSMPWIWEADTALYKAGLVPAWLAQHALDAHLSSPQGYIWAQHAPPPDFPGHAWQPEWVLPWKPDALKKQLRGLKQLWISARDAGMPVEAQYKVLGLRPGGTRLLLLTRMHGERWAILCREAKL